MNTDKPVECLRCHAHMEAGFVGDRWENGCQQQIWVRGAPQRSFWTGLKVRKDQIVPVITVRCPTCGYLESYAIPQTVSER